MVQQQPQSIMMSNTQLMRTHYIPEEFADLPGMPKGYGDEERSVLKSLFLSHRQKLMRDLLEKRAGVILQGNDLIKWKYKKWNADYCLIPVLFKIPLDLFFSCFRKKTNLMLAISDLYIPCVIPFCLYLYYIQRKNLQDISRRYLTHLNDEELE
jgi:hypothetical protein